MHKRFGSSFIRVLAVTVGLTTVGLVATPGVSHASEKYYVSLGDSYSIGYQPLPTAGPTPGYTAVVAADKHLQLENFGCGGATTTSILTTVGCPPGATAGTDAVPYPTQTQIAAADAFITAHPGQIGLITVSISGNDVTACALAPSPVACVLAATASIKTNVKTLVTDLRTAAGKSVPIVGLTYPDVILGSWVFPTSPPSAASKTLVSESVLAFKSFINPTLKTAYKSAKAKFIDVTAKTKAYTPLTKMTTLAPYGSIPSAVAQVCTLTWYCQLGNIHAKTVGYQLIGNLIDKAAKIKA